MAVRSRSLLAKTAAIALASCSLVVGSVSEAGNLLNHSDVFNVSRSRHYPIAMEKDASNPLTPPAHRPSCASNETGFFGFFSNTNVTIPYYYEIEYLAENPDLNADILPMVERAVSDAVLPVLFASRCGTNSGRRELSLRHGRKLYVNGVSALPPDEVSECE